MNKTDSPFLGDNDFFKSHIVDEETGVLLKGKFVTVKNKDGKTFKRWDPRAKHEKPEPRKAKDPKNQGRVDAINKQSKKLFDSYMQLMNNGQTIEADEVKSKMNDLHREWKTLTGADKDTPHDLPKKGMDFTHELTVKDLLKKKDKIGSVDFENTRMGGVLKVDGKPHTYFMKKEQFDAIVKKAGMVKQEGTAKYEFVFPGGKTLDSQTASSKPTGSVEDRLKKDMGIDLKDYPQMKKNIEELKKQKVSIITDQKVVEVFEKLKDKKAKYTDAAAELDITDKKTMKMFTDQMTGKKVDGGQKGDYYGTVSFIRDRNKTTPNITTYQMSYLKNGWSGFDPPLVNISW